MSLGPTTAAATATATDQGAAMKRYDLETRGPPYLQYGTLVESEYGDWASWEDVERLLYAAKCLVHAYETDNRPCDSWIKTIKQATERTET